MSDTLNKEKKEKINEIPRYSELSLSPSERERLLEECWDDISKGLKIPKENIELAQDIVEGEIAPLYEEIGHLDYEMYYGADDNISDDKKLENIKAYLVNRAYKSARLKAFIDETNKKGFKMKPGFKLENITSKELSDKYGEKICHGTVVNLQEHPEKLGEIDENGKYKIKDGILYFAKRKHAEHYVNRMVEKNPDIEQKPWIYERDISQSYENNECVKLGNRIETSGWTGYLYQDEIKQLCEEGKKYIFGAGTQILDIHNFADFVNKRDATILETLEKYNLRLPSPEESLTAYIESLGITKQQFEDIISADKNREKWSVGRTTTQ